MQKRWPKLPQGSTTWSYTALDQWRCPYRGHQLRDLHLKEPLGEGLQDGRLLHDAIGTYLQHCLEGNVGTDPAAMETFAHRAFFAADPREPHGLPLGAWDEIRDLANGFAREYVMRPALVASIEEPVAIDLGGGHHWLGVLDLVEMDGAEAWVHDWKSDRHLPSRADAEDSFQLRVYAWMLCRQYTHLKAVHSCLSYLRYGLRERSVDFTRTEALAVEDEIRGRIAQVLGWREQRKWPAAAGDYCRYCGFVSTCPTWKAMGSAAPVLVTEPDTANAAASALSTLDRRRTQLNDALKAYTADHGPVELDGLAYGHFVTESIRVPDVQTVIDRFTAAGIPVADLLRVDTQAVQAMHDEDPRLDLLADLIEDASHTAFRSKRTAPKARGRKEATA